MTDIKQLLTMFSEASGVSGYEDEIRDVLHTVLTDLVDDVRVDAIGNMIGTRTGDGPRVMIAAHMDEIGLMVKYIDEQGYLRFVTLGGWYDQVLLGQRVVVHGCQGPLIGVVGSKPPHIMDDDERKKIVKAKDMFIDIGATNADNAAALGVEIGSVVTMDRNVASMANGFITGKCFDDRAGLVMMVSALERLKHEDVQATILAVGTVQEEVGLKGARTSAFALDPDVAIISETTIPGDHPGVAKEQRHQKCGAGPAITIVDADGRGVIVPRKVVNWLKDAAERVSVPYQLDVASGGTTDATAVHLTKGGIPSGVVSVATRYIHSPVEVLSLADLESASALIAEAVRTAHNVFAK